MTNAIRAFRTVLVSLTALGASMNAFGFLGFGNSASWKEEALLHDGRKLIVERSQTYGGYPAIESRERAVLDEEWTFRNPDNRQQVTWKVNHRRPPEGESLMLMILDILNGTPYIASVPAGCIAYNHWGRPNPPYVFFKFDGKKWQRIPIDEFPAVFKDANVVVGGRMNPKDQAGTTLSVAKVKEDNRLLEPYLRLLVREPITYGPGNLAATCPDNTSPRYTSPKAPNPMPFDTTGGIK